jgi:hypothetical protein
MGECKGGVGTLRNIGPVPLGTLFTAHWSSETAYIKGTEKGIPTAPDGNVGGIPWPERGRI